MTITPIWTVYLHAAALSVVVTPLKDSVFTVSFTVVQTTLNAEEVEIAMTRIPLGLGYNWWSHEVGLRNSWGEPMDAKELVDKITEVYGIMDKTRLVDLVTHAFEAHDASARALALSGDTPNTHKNVLEMQIAFKNKTIKDLEARLAATNKLKKKLRKFLESL